MMLEPLSILFQDDHLVAINKPSGLLVHRSEMDRYETQNAMRQLRNQLGQWVYLIHRLDKPTSGVLLFALDSETARRVIQSFKDKQISKSYLAVVRGFTKETERIDYPLKEIWDKMTDALADTDKPDQVAITEYQRLSTVELPFPVGRYPTARYSLLKVNPITGRNRQIRRHLKHIFHPIVGDTSHGDGDHNTFFRQQFNCHRLLLHAHTLTLPHPYSTQQIKIQAPLENSFQHVLDKIQLKI